MPKKQRGAGFSFEDDGGGECEKKEVLTWGEGHPTIENHTKDYCCLNIECQLYDRPSSIISQEELLNEMTVGIKEAPYSISRSLHLARICECPKCFQQFWFHIDELTAESLKEQRRKKNEKEYE